MAGLDKVLVITYSLRQTLGSSLISGIAECMLYSHSELRVEVFCFSILGLSEFLRSIQGVRLEEVLRTSLIIKRPGLVSKQKLSKVLELNIESDSSDKFPN
jgi:hypothetical protein